MRPLTVGTCIVRARQSGNAGFLPATAVPAFNVTAGQRPQTITFDEQIPDRSILSAPAALSAKASSSSVTYTASEFGCLVVDNVVTIIALFPVASRPHKPATPSMPVPFPVTRRSFVVFEARLSERTSTGCWEKRSILCPRKPSPSSPTLPSSSQTLAIAPSHLRDSAGTVRTLSTIYAGESRINVLLPEATANGTGILTVTTTSGSAGLPITLAPAAPGLFSANGTGQGLAAAQAQIVNADRSITTLTVGDSVIPVRTGTEIYLILYGTGIRGHGPEVSALAAGRPAEVLYAGPQGAFPGLDQVNVRAPLDRRGSGNVEIRLTVDGVLANTVTATFQQALRNRTMLRKATRTSTRARRRSSSSTRTA